MNRRSETTTKVFVGSLPTGVTTDDLRGLFAPYGSIAECDISNRCGFLHLEDHELALKAISELNGTNFMGGRISVEKGRVKPRRTGPGGPMRGGKDRGGPYARNTDFRGGPPHRNGGGGGGFGAARDFPPYGGDGDRFGAYDRPQRGGYDAAYADRRPPYDDRRAVAAYGERRPYDYAYPDDRAGAYPEPPRSEYDDRRPPVGAEYDDRRPLLTDRRPLLDQQGPPPPRGPTSYDSRGAPVAELYSRRDQGPKPMPAGGAAVYADRSGYGVGAANGYTGAYGGAAPAAAATATAASVPGAYGSQSAAAAGGYAAGYGTAAQPAPAYPDTRGYAASTAAYGNPGAYGDYGAASARGSYDAAYPPLPQQRGGYASGGDPGLHRGDMVSGRRY